MDSAQISFGIAFVAGLVSFLSPCVLPLVPIYLAQLVGHSVYQAADGQEEQPQRLNTFIHSLMFVLGFTLAFVALGATASTLGGFLRSYQLLLRQIGGVILVIFGLHLTGIFKLSIFYWQKHFEFRPSRPSYPASLLIGLIFAIGWTPCVGLILGPILGLAANAATLRQGGDTAAVLLAWVGPTVSAPGFESGSTQQSAQVAQTPCREDRSRYRRCNDYGGDHYLLQPASLLKSFL